MRRPLLLAAAALALPVVSLAAPQGEAGTFVRAKKAGVRYHLDFDHADIVDVVKTLSGWTGRNFILSDSVRGKITIIGPTDVTADEAYDAFIAALDTNGLTVVQSGAFYRILPKKDAPRFPIPTDLSGR